MSYKDYRDVFRLMDREMQQLSDEVFRGFFDPLGGRFWQPPIDIYESETDLLIKVELPGVRTEDISVSLSADDRALTVSGLRKESEGERRGRMRCHQLEIYFGPFERIVPLPVAVPIDREQIKAVHREGFLVVTIPKVEKPISNSSRTIPISSDDEPRSGAGECDE